MRFSAEVQGDPDTQPMIIFSGYGRDVVIESAKAINRKIRGGIRININEAVMAMAAYVMRQIAAGVSADDIGEQVCDLISPDNVMIGVPESMRRLVFRMASGSSETVLILDSPIRISRYVLRGS